MKIVKIIILLSILINVKTVIYGISDDFKFVIDTIGIPRYNVYNQEINEEIYKAYNIFVYSNPEALLTHSSQRFKTELNNGKWTRHHGSYKGYGERGEYYILGRSYSGSIICNVYFAPDFLPETTPDNWVYLTTGGAYASWFDTTKYKYAEQLDYMKSTKLLFDEINYANNTINPYNLVAYNINVNTIGLNKVTLNAASTWRTYGIVTIRRRTIHNTIRYAVLATAPMAANANVLSKLDVSNNNVLKEDVDSITIPITISAEAINLTNHAKEKHIKEIVSILYINNKEITRVSGSKTVKVDKKTLFTVTRDDYSIPKTYPIDIKVKSYLYTEFSVDGLMMHEIQKTINLQVLEKEVIPIQNIDVSILEKENNNLVVRPLVQTTNTNSSHSKGIIETGKYLAVKLNKNVKDINYDVYINNKKINYDEIYSNDNISILQIKIDDNLSNTLKSWNYLRDTTGNYFDVNFSQVGERIKTPNELKIMSNSKYTDIIKFDSIDKFTNNINYIFNNNVLNSYELNNKTLLNDWITNE